MNTNKHLMLLATLFFMFLVSTPQNVSAKEVAEQKKAAISLHEKPQNHGAILSLRISAFTGVQDWIGVSLSLKFLHPFELEAGASGFLFGETIYGRAGVSLSLFDYRDAFGHGWNMRFLGMGGYRFVDKDKGGGKDHRLTAHVGIEATYWIFKRFGVEMQLSAGGELSLVPHQKRFAPDARFSVGFAF